MSPFTHTLFPPQPPRTRTRLSCSFAARSLVSPARQTLGVAPSPFAEERPGEAPRSPVPRQATAWLRLRSAAAVAGCCLSRRSLHCRGRAAWGRYSAARRREAQPIPSGPGAGLGARSYRGRARAGARLALPGPWWVLWWALRWVQHLGAARGGSRPMAPSRTVCRGFLSSP